MAINVFEGARRIMVLVAMLVAGFILVIAFNKQTVFVYFTVSWPGETPAWSESRNEEGRKEYKYFTTKNGTEAHVDVTFLYQPSADGRSLVYYRDESGKVWGNDSYSSAVSAYTSRFIKDFTVSPEVERWIDKEGRRLFKARLLEFGGYLVAWMFFLWVFTVTIGWIVRGFLGIPRGMDSKPEPPAKVEADGAKP